MASKITVTQHYVIEREVTNSCNTVNTLPSINLLRDGTVLSTKIFFKKHKLDCHWYDWTLNGKALINLLFFIFLFYIYHWVLAVLLHMHDNVFCFILYHLCLKIKYDAHSAVIESSCKLLGFQCIAIFQQQNNQLWSIFMQ